MISLEDLFPLMWSNISHCLDPLGLSTLVVEPPSGFVDRFRKRVGRTVPKFMRKIRESCCGVNDTIWLRQGQAVETLGYEPLAIEVSDAIATNLRANVQQAGRYIAKGNPEKLVFPTMAWRR